MHHEKGVPSGIFLRFEYVEIKSSFDPGNEYKYYFNVFLVLRLIKFYLVFKFPNNFDVL